MSEVEAATAGKAILTVREIGQSFGPVDVLKDISFDLSEGSLTTLVGPNGAGKTTLLRIVSGLDRADEGQVTIRTDAEHPVGYLPQNPGFRPVFTVEETLTFYASVLDASPDPDRVMERVGLLGVRDRRVGDLSGGMRRLLGLAGALLGGPPLLVLDEPTSGLDPRMTEHFFETVGTATGEETTVLLSTHDLTYAARTDSVVLLNEGRVAFTDAPAEALERTGTDSLTDAFTAMVGTDPTVQTGLGERGGEDVGIETTEEETT